MHKFNWLRENARLRILIAWKSTVDTNVKIRFERAYKRCCVLCRLGQFSMSRKCLSPFLFWLGLEIYVMDCLHLWGIQVKLLLMQILYQQLVIVRHFHASHFASVSEIASTNPFRVYSWIFSDFVDLYGVFIVWKYCYSLLKSSW